MAELKTYLINWTVGAPERIEVENVTSDSGAFIFWSHNSKVLLAPHESVESVRLVDGSVPIHARSSRPWGTCKANVIPQSIAGVACGRLLGKSDVCPVHGVQDDEKVFVLKSFDDTVIQVSQFWLDRAKELMKYYGPISIEPAKVLGAEMKTPAYSPIPFELVVIANRELHEEGHKYRQ